MKKFIYFGLLALVFSCTNTEQTSDKDQPKKDSIYLMSLYRHSTQIDSNEWKLISSIPPKDTSNVLFLVYKDEVGFSLNDVYCMAIFENKKGTEYKLVAPWLNSMIVQKSNLLMEKSTLVPKSEMKKVYIKCGN